MRSKKLLMISLTLALFSMLLSPAPVHANTFTVTNTDDSGVGSLREAILRANANAGPDTIQFNISGCGGVCTIQPNSPLPDLIDGETIIDGYSQPGASPATSSRPAALLITIDGSNAGPRPGLTITSGDNEVRGLSIINFNVDGIAIRDTGATNNVVAGNYLGVDPTGNSASNGLSGIFIDLGAHRNTIGGDQPADRNVISGNGKHGVSIVGEGAKHNVIINNYIGTAANGMTALGNGENGVCIEDGAQENQISGNVIADNNNGVVIQSAFFGVLMETSYNSVQDNAIGVAADGISPLGNAGTGVRIGWDTQSNIVRVNIIAHNGADGVNVDTPSAYDNFILRNSIHDNGGLGIHLTNGANGEIMPPIIHNVDLSAQVVSGAARPNSLVQVFSNLNDDGEGKTFIGEAEAGPAGDFDVTFTSLTSGYLTATATNIYEDEGTSEFSAVYAVTFRTFLPLVVCNP